MRHLKTFNESENKDLDTDSEKLEAGWDADSDNLEDYLQEFFDEYCVTPWNEKPLSNPFYYIRYGVVIIQNFTEEIYDKMFESLYKISDLLEKRLHRKIEISGSVDKSWLRITLQYHF